MKPEEIVKAAFDAVQKGDFKKARTYLSDDFQFSGPVPEPLGADQWLGLSANLLEGFPDLDYHFRVESVSGDVVNCSVQMSGSHKGTLDMRAMGMGEFPATGKTFKASLEHAKLTVHGEKISELRVQPSKTAGVPFILESIGVKMPVV